MASHPLLDFIRRLRHARSVAEGGHLLDAQLLQRFAQQRDEAAFEVLVWRHGTMVLNVAQRLLRQSVDAEDVFQATFLTLARKASAIRRGTSVGSWLYKVAYRLALRARQTAARRQRYEQAGIENASAPIETDDAEVSAVLAQEVDRLPERYRAVVVLCYLQGATTEEASRLLGWPRGTVLSRLASARQRLRQRLIRRGIAPAGALAAISLSETASAAPTVALVAFVVRAALPFAAGGAAVPIVSPQAAALAEGALQMMMWNKIKLVAALVCVIALVGTGSGWLARGHNAVETSLPAAEPQAKQQELHAAAPDRANQLQKAIEEISVRLAKLAQLEDDMESRFTTQEIEAQVRLDGCKYLLHRHEQEIAFGLQQNNDRQRERRRAAEARIVELERTIRSLVEVEENKKLLKELKENLEVQREIIRDTDRRRRDHEREHDNAVVAIIRGDREEVFKAEYELRRIERRHAREREGLAAKRQALSARLEQLENLAAGLEPTDDIRDVERKLDAIRREVGELRRAVEGQNKH